MSNYPPPQGPSENFPPPAESQQPPPVLPPNNGMSGIAWLAIGASIALIAVLIGAGLTFVLTRSDNTNDAEGANDVVTVSTEPISTATDPFTPPIAPEGETTTDIVVADPVETPEPITVEGGRVGLYGGTENVAQCDKEKLVTFLEGSPQKAAGWAQVQGIQVSQIRSFVTQLTQVVLRSDTRVTNHGWENGQVTTIQAVLQAGSAVLVNEYGLPVVKCYCGNPLTAPPPINNPVYTGPTWSGWNPQSITVIQQNVTVINDFTVINVTNNQTFGRPAGTDGSQDGPRPTTASQPPGPSSSPSPSITSNESAAQAVKDAILAGLRKCAGRYDAVESLEENLQLYTFTAKKLSNPNMWQVTAVGEGDTYKWNVNDQTRKVTAANPLAGELDTLCPGDITG
jgi:hypothetical protein